MLFRLNRRPPDLKTGYPDVALGLEGVAGDPPLRIRRTRNCFQIYVTVDAESPASLRAPRDGQRAAMTLRFRRPAGRVAQRVTLRATPPLGDDDARREADLRRLGCPVA